MLSWTLDDRLDAADRCANDEGAVTSPSQGPRVCGKAPVLATTTCMLCSSSSYMTLLPISPKKLATPACVITTAEQTCISHVMLWKNSSNSHGTLQRFAHLHRAGRRLGHEQAKA